MVSELWRKRLLRIAGYRIQTRCWCQEIIVKRNEDTLLELVRHVIDHIAFEHAVDAAGMPMVKITVFTKRGAFMGEYYDGKKYEPGADFFVDIAALRRAVDRQDAGQSPIIKKRLPGVKLGK